MVDQHVAYESCYSVLQCNHKQKSGICWKIEVRSFWIVGINTKAKVPHVRAMRRQQVLRF